MSLGCLLYFFIFLLNLQVVGAVSATLFLTLSLLFKNKSFQLLHSLIICDLTHFVLGMVYTGYLITHWNSEELNYDPFLIFLTSAAIMIHIKVNLVILIGMAIDRIMAIYSPTFYHFLHHQKYNIFVITIAAIVGVGDYSALWITSPLTRKPNCSAVGCFMSDIYRQFWGISNGVLGLFLLTITVILIIKLNVMATNYAVARDRERIVFLKANRVAMCSLISGIFITGPAVFIGLFQLTSHDLYLVFGPFYLPFLLIAGCSNSISQLLLNKEFRREMKSLCKAKMIKIDFIDSSGRHAQGSTK